MIKKLNISKIAAYTTKDLSPQDLKILEDSSKELYKAYLHLTNMEDVTKDILEARGMIYKALNKLDPVLFELPIPER